MRIQINPILASTQHDCYGRLTETLSQVPRSSVLRGGFAFVSWGGAQTLIDRLHATPGWVKREKHFLVGLFQGITEPAALDLLRTVPNTTLKVFLPRKRLDEQSLFTKPMFHPKVLAITSRAGKKLSFIQVSSANLTVSAIGILPQNHELGVSLSDVSGNIDSDDAFMSWWTGLWNSGRIASPKLIADYASIRRKFVKKNPIVLSNLDPPTEIATAETFFIEVGAGSGPPGQRHQVEFTESLAQFFGTVVRGRRDVTLRRSGQEWTGRPLSYKRTTYGVEIWRLGMPTQASGGVPVAERAIMFRRTAVPNVFDFEVSKVSASAYSEWVRDANRYGHLGATHGLRQRQFGFV